MSQPMSPKRSLQVSTYLLLQRQGSITMSRMKPGSTKNHLVRGRVRAAVGVRVRVRIAFGFGFGFGLGLGEGEGVRPREAHEMQVLVSQPSSIVSVAARP